MELIDKDTIVAEIEKRLDELWNLLPNASDVIKDNYTKEEANIIGKYTALESFEKFINTLEVKEVDSEKKLSLEDYKSFFEKHPDLSDDWGFDEAWMFAKYFYELGLNTRKEE